MCGNRCCSKQGFNKGSWSATEDKILADYVRTHGEGKWGEVPKRAGLHRCPRSCRLRWLNYLRPDIKRGNISLDEEDLIIRLHNLLGNRWSLIAGRLPGRTDNEIKNYWNTVLKKKVQAQPVTSMNPLRSDKDGDTKRKSRKRIRRPGLDNSTSCNEEASVSHQHDDRNAPVKEFEESLVSTGDILFDISFSEPEDFDLFSPLMGSELCPRHLLDLDFFETSGSNLQKDIRNWSNSPVSFDDNEFFSKGVSDTWFDGDSSQPYGGMNLESPTTFFQSESEYPSLWKGMV